MPLNYDSFGSDEDYKSKSRDGSSKPRVLKFKGVIPFKLRSSSKDTAVKVETTQSETDGTERSLTTN